MIINYYLSFKYLPATLKANEGNITKTVANRSLINILLIYESGASGPEPVITTKIPKIPNTIDEYIKIRVAIFCINKLYHIL
jgi:hypothetical protein